LRELPLWEKKFAILVIFVVFFRPEIPEYGPTGVKFDHNQFSPGVAKKLNKVISTPADFCQLKPYIA